MCRWHDEGEARQATSARVDGRLLASATRDEGSPTGGYAGSCHLVCLDPAHSRQISARVSLAQFSLCGLEPMCLSGGRQSAARTRVLHSAGCVRTRGVSVAVARVRCAPSVLLVLAVLREARLLWRLGQRPPRPEPT